jgi:uncharacterized membrane protein YdbT with pleckstrin-like domain
MIKKFFEKITGLDKVREETARAEARMTEAIEAAASQQREAEKARQAAEQAKLSPKEVATQKKEPWVGVLDTHVNKENVRNGFFELDWNEYFVVQLKSAGYVGESDEEIVDKWFQELCRNVGAEAGVNMDRRGSGYVNRALRDDGLTEVF